MIAVFVYGRTFEDGVKCLTDYSNKCLADRPGRMAKTIMRSVKDHYEKRCKDKDYGAEFMEHNKCFDDPAVFEQFHQCADRWYYRMQELGKQSWDVERGIQSSCCIFHEFQRCIREANVNVCHDRNARFWDDTLDEVVSGPPVAVGSSLFLLTLLYLGAILVGRYGEHILCTAQDT